MQKVDTYNRTLKSGKTADFGLDEWSRCSAEYHSDWKKISPELQGIILHLAELNSDGSFKDIALPLVKRPWVKPTASMSTSDYWESRLPTTSSQYLLRVGGLKERKAIEIRIMQGIDPSSSAMMSHYFWRYKDNGRPFLKSVVEKADKGLIPAIPNELDLVKRLLTK